MSLPDDHRLSTQRGRLAATLAERLAAGDAPLPELRELQERIKLLDGAIAEQAEQGAQAGRGKHRLAALLWPLALVGFVLLVAASVPVPRVPLSLTLKASAVQLVLAEATQLGPLTVNADIRVEGFNTLESADPVLRAAAAAGGPADSVSVRAAESRLRALRLPAGASLSVEARRDALALLVESARAPVVAELEVRGAATVLVGDAAEPLLRDYPRSEWMRLLAGDAAKPAQAPPPMAVSLGRRSSADKAPWQLSGLKPAGLRFVERREGAVGDRSALVSSSLLGGTLTLPATGQTLALAAGDGLELDGLRLARFEILAGTSPLLIELNGSAQGLRQRVGEFEHSLKPSWLEYVSRHHLTQLLWGSAAVLWGALAWLRRQWAAVQP